MNENKSRNKNTCSVVEIEDDNNEKALHVDEQVNFFDLIVELSFTGGWHVNTSNLLEYSAQTRWNTDLQAKHLLALHRGVTI